MEVTKTVVKQHIYGTHNGFHKVKVTKTGLEHLIYGMHHNFMVTINHSINLFVRQHYTKPQLLWIYGRFTVRTLKLYSGPGPNGVRLALSQLATLCELVR